MRIIARSVLPIVCIAMAVIGTAITGCSSSTGPDTPGQGISLKVTDSEGNKADNEDVLSGELTVSVDGEAPGEDISELRVYVDEEEIITQPHPVWPYESTVASYTFTNGSHTISAELDLPAEDTTHVESVSGTFENYLLTINTDGHLSNPIRNNDYTGLIITDHRGEILRNIDVTNKGGEVLTILPPEELEEIPPYLSVTIASERDSNKKMTTNVVTSLWTTIPEGKSTASRVKGQPTGQENALRVEVDNVPYHSGFHGHIISDASNGKVTVFDSETDTFAHSFEYSDLNQLITLIRPDFGETHHSPMFTWERDVSDLSLGAQDTIRYDAAADFQEMAVHTVPHAADLDLYWYAYSVSAEPTSWDQGILHFPAFDGPQNDYHDRQDQLGIFIPDRHHLYQMNITMTSADNRRVEYQQITSGSLPAEFQKKASGTATVAGDFEEINLQLSGSTDYVSMDIQYRDDYSPYNRLWRIAIPDTLESYSIPQIRDFLDWERLFLYAMTLHEVQNFDGYEDFLEDRWGSEFIDRGNIFLMRRVFSPDQ